MKILLVSPKYPDTFWSFKHALRFISKKTSNPPLGLLTVASILPKEWHKKLVDMNVNPLNDKDIRWADYVFIGAMSIQSDSVEQIIERCKKLNACMVAGGPLFTGEPERFPDVQHLVLNEAEITLPLFLEDLSRGTPQNKYSTIRHADMSLSPLPDYSLIDVSNYAQMGIQFSRGCPYDCEFCEITALLGHKFRTKSTYHILQELENIYLTGFRGNVFFVDDNFIGNIKRLKTDLLPAMIKWTEEKNRPFAYTTEATINLSDDPELMDKMANAGFVKVFVGIESPDEASLEECNKKQNRKRNLINSVNRIQLAGLEVCAGFIVGFDNDTPEVFEHQIDFIQKTGIITAMVGLLNAPNNTKLFKRLLMEGRILKSSTGDNTSYSINFIPKMDKEVLMNGYQYIIKNIYSSKAYHERVLRFLKMYRPKFRIQTRLSWANIMIFLRSVFLLGIFNKSRIYFWKLFFWSLFNRPETFPLAITYSIHGYHFRKVFRDLS